jgi:predicted TIM-barrel fold metal-dependent hydrolase
VEALAGLERELEAGLGLAGRGGWWDAHVHLGRDRDGHGLAVDDLVRDLDRWGMAAAVAFPPDDPGPDGQFESANLGILNAARAHPGRIVPFCRLDPERPWEAALRRAAAEGARGLKLHPVAQRFRPEGPACVALVRAAAELGWPVLIHAGYGARPLAEPLGRLAEAVPDTRLILAHAARGDARAVAARLAGRPGVRYDTSLAALPDLLILPPEALVFGSDRPYGEHGTALQLVALAARLGGWDASQVRGLMGENLRAWLDG